MRSPCTPFFDFLTPDLINQILVRLPVKSLLCCKSVSKPWLSLISNPNFIKSHHKRTITTPGADQVLFVTERGTSLSLLYLDSCEIGARLGDFSSVPYFKTAGCCNGIVCFWHSSASRDGRPCTYLWNPATKQAKIIPPIDLKWANVIFIILGFGFDPEGNDYKVVALLGSVSGSLTAEVYSTNTNVWRKVEPDPKEIPSNADFDVCVNGFLCCISYESRYRSYAMLAFDLNKEVFTCGIKLPEGYSPIRITDFKDSIAVTASKEHASDNLLHLWKLDDEACLRDSGVEASWTLMFSIDVGRGVECVFGYFHSGDLLLRTEEDNAWILYNSHKNEARNVPVSLDDRRSLKYNESLVKITGFEPVYFDAREDDN